MMLLPPSLLQEQLVAGHGSFRMVWWAGLSSCVLKNRFFFFFLQGRTCMRASGLVIEAHYCRGLDPGSAMLVSREILN